MSRLGIGVQLRIAIRSLTRARVFTVTVIVLMGLGIGAVTTVFTVVDHVLLRPLPYPDPERLVFVGKGPVLDEWEPHSGPVVQAMQQIDAIDAWAIAHTYSANLTDGFAPSRIIRAEISRDFFAVFGGRPTLGRLLQPDDFATADRALVSHRTWTRHFGGDPQIVGKTIRVDGQPLTVVGVLSAEFQPPQALVAATVDVWQPIDWRLPLRNRIDAEELEVAGRLATGVTRAAAQAEFDALAQAMAGRYPDRFIDHGKVVPLPLMDFQHATVQRVRAGLHLLLGAVALLLLVACLNVAHLFLARGVGRLQEMRIRRALGAGIGALVQPLLAESLLVGAAGGALGLLLATVGLNALLQLSPGTLPIGGEVIVDLRVLAFAVVVSLGTAAVFGLLPALRTASDNAVSVQQGGRRTSDNRGATRLRNGLVVAEVAFSLVLVTQAGLLLRSFMQVHAHESGVDPGRVLTVPLFDPGANSGTEFVRTMNAVRSAIEGVPGVQAAAYGLNLPFQVTGGRRFGWSNRFEMVAGGVRHDPIVLRQMPVSPTYFEVLGIPMMAGEPWSEAEGLAPVEPTAGESNEEILPVVLAERTAVYFFGAAELAVGRTMWHAEAPTRQWRVTGVARDVRHWGLDQPVPDVVYLPTHTIPGIVRSVSMAVRLHGEPSPDFQGSIRDAVWSVAPDIPVPDIVPMTALIERSTAGRRFDSVLFGLFGLFGLFLAAAGLYGSLLFVVRQRWRELGIRRALGATSSRVEREVVGDGLKLALVGLAMGLIGWGCTGRLLKSRLYEVDVADPTTLVLSAVVLLGTAALASWLPARRAGQVDPLEALRAE